MKKKAVPMQHAGAHLRVYLPDIIPRKRKRKLVEKPKRRPKTPPRCTCAGDTRCRASTLESEPHVTHARLWRQEWKQLSLKSRRNSLLAYFRSLEGLEEHQSDQALRLVTADGRQAFATRAPLVHKFLGVRVCKTAFVRHTRVRYWRARKQHARGETTYQHPGFGNRYRPRQEEMRCAIEMLVELLRASSPFQNSDPNEIVLPFSEKKILFQMLLQRYKACNGPTPPGPSMAILFSKPPKVKTFYKVLQCDPDLSKVKFHRVVAIGRCPKCCFLRWKCLSAITPAERRGWQEVAARHQTLQLAQKKVYATDRARAAMDYPETEIYMAFDGGSGHEFWLPHFSPNSAEVASKQVDGVHTPCFKIMNGVIHGDSRSHVIISPPSVVAGANHVCESLLIAINTAYHEHGDLPTKFSVQLDNASPNHNTLVFTFIGLYVLFGVFDVARIRFELPDHAHDIYDLFQAIHKTAVCRATYFSLAELIDIIKSAHLGGRETALMGKDVLVSNLWQVRDFWEWLFPGHGQKGGETESFTKGAGIFYDGMAQYHDFELRRFTGDGGELQVGLWGKRFMSDGSLRLIGTLTSWNLYRAVTENQTRRVQLQSRQTSEGKSHARFHDTLQKLEKLTQGPYAEQFSQERLADAMAICREDWDHFRNSAGAIPADRQWLPGHLAAIMHKRRLRSAPRGSLEPPGAIHVGQDWLEGRGPIAGAMPMRQRLHNLALLYGIVRGAGVTESNPYGGGQAKSVAELAWAVLTMCPKVCDRKNIA